MEKSLELNNGRKIPLLGLGTWKSAPGEVKSAVKEAIRVGYRHIDCAYFYGNEKEVGEALSECIKENICTREDLFVTSKLWNSFHEEADVLPALEISLKNLQLDYLDMYLIHWPVVEEKGSSFGNLKFRSLEEVPLASTWKGMESAVKEGKAKGIGVSNFSVKKLKSLLESSEIPPAVNQVERHPYLQQPKLMEFCSANKIHLTCYSPLGSTDRPESFKDPNDPKLMEDSVIVSIAKKHSITPAQVILKWAMQTNTSTIPKSVNPGRIAQNLQATTEPILDADDLSALAALNRNARFVRGDFWTNVSGSPYTLENLWDGE